MKTEDSDNEYYKMIPPQLRNKLYLAVQTQGPSHTKHIHEDQIISASFYENAKTLSNGIEDCFTGNEINYYKSNKKLGTREIPIVFKNMQKNVLFLSNQMINI